MSNNKGQDKSVPKTQKGSVPRRRKSLLAKALRTFEDTLIAEKELKPTLAEYLKLLQIERELEPELPREITVTWVEPPAVLKEE
jgi:hypothetical protein